MLQKLSIMLLSMATLNSGTQFPLKMLSDAISYHANFKIFHFQHYYPNMYLLLCNCERALCAWLSVPIQTFPLIKCFRGPYLQYIKYLQAEI